VTENKVLRTFGARREEVAGGWRRLQDDELHNLYASPNTLRLKKSRGMRRMGHAVRRGVMRNA
jgi:hypothetical protein